MLISLENTQNTLFVYNIILKDDDGKFWCSTKVDDSGVHIGKKGYWGYCEKWSYSISCKFGLVMGKIQSYINNKLGASGIKVTRILSSTILNITNFEVCMTYFYDNFQYY